MTKNSYELKEIRTDKTPDEKEEKLRGDTTEGKDGEEEKKTSTFRELFRYSKGIDKFLIFTGIIFSIAHGAGWPALAIVFGRMTNTFLGGEPSQNISATTIDPTTNDTTVPTIGEHVDLNELITEIMIQFIYIGLGVFVTTYFQISLWVTASERQTHKIRQHFFRAILRQDMGWFDKRQSGELTTRLADDLERIREGLGEKISLCLQLFATFVTGYAVGFWQSWKMTLVLLSLMPLLAAAGAFLSKRVTSISRREQKAYAGAGCIAEEVLSCIRTVVSFNGQHREYNRYSEALDQGKWLGIKKSAITGLGVGMMFLLMFSAYALAFWYGSTLVAEYHETGGEEGISPGTVFTVFFSVMMGTMSLGNVAPHVAIVMTAKGAGATVMQIIDNIPSIDATSEEGKKLDSVEGTIDLREVEFAYPIRKDINVLKDFTLSIKRGQTVALVGASGCGKSTIINLILRFYDPLAGNVFLDGCNLKKLNPAWLRQQIGLVSQEPILFDCSISDNIKLGQPDVTQDQVIQAARRANAHNFISELPKGYDTLVGERGAQMSGGQKQRIAIARALIRDPKILLLDEATSALDVESEGVVQQALDKAREGRTTIIIAHRLSTVKNANAIYVIKDGAIVEHGCHRTLMSQRGEYFQLVTGQTFEIDEDEEDDNDVDDHDVADNTISDGDIRNGQLPTTPTRLLYKSKRQTSRLSESQTSDVKELEDSKKDKTGDAKQATFIRMLRSNSPEWVFILGGCIGATIGGSIMPLFAVFFSMVLKTLGESDPAVIRRDIVKWSLLYLALGVIAFVGNLLKNMMFGQSGERLTKRLRLQSFKAMLRQDITFFDDHENSSGALTTRLATDASLVNSATGIRMGVVTQSAVCIVAALAVAFFFGWKLTLVILGSLPLMAVAGVINMKTAYKDQKKGSKHVQSAGKVAGEAIENIRTVQALTREHHFFDKYRTFLRESHVKAIRQAQFYGVSYGFSQAIIFFIYGGAFKFGAYLISEGEMEPPEVYRVFFAITLSGMVIGQTMGFLPEYTKARSAAGRIFDIIDKVPSIDIDCTTGKQVKDTNGALELQNVTFRYPTRPDVDVLSNLTLHIRPGLTTALVGVSGCGKSTVMSLIQRYYDADSGRVLLDGVDIKYLSVTSLRSVLSVVSQEPVLFACSVRDNILYGLEDDNIPMDKVIAAARMANIHEFISSLPNGYDTEVGEKGTQLSGGQKQRVAIARAIIRNPRVLLLDEATSALDSESEKLVQAALDNAKAGRTCLVIAHRLSTIQNADHICVITDGQISEQGTHAELVSRKGLYADLVSGQQIARED